MPERCYASDPERRRSLVGGDSVPPVVEVVVQCGQRNESAGGDGLAVGLVPPVGDATLGGAAGVEPVGDARVPVGDDRPEHAVGVDHRLDMVAAAAAAASTARRAAPLLCRTTQLPSSKAAKFAFRSATGQGTVSRAREQRRGRARA